MFNKLYLMKGIASCGILFMIWYDLEICWGGPKNQLFLSNVFETSNIITGNSYSIGD